MTHDDHQATPPTLQRGTSALVIARAIRNDIEAGILRHGQQLPSTRALADQWKTSVATVTRAMNLLGEEGIVINRARSSRIVHNPPNGPTQEYRPKRPEVVLIGGYAGSGKTELGHVLSRASGWSMLDKDTTTRPVVETALVSLGQSRDDRESDTYVRQIRPGEYEALLAGVVENVELGNSVITTAPFLKEFSDPAWLARIKATVESLGADLSVVWVRCDADSMLMYLRRRGAARDSSKLADWDGYLSRINLAFEPAIEPHHVIDNSVGSRPLQVQADELLRAIVSA